MHKINDVLFSALILNIKDTCILTKQFVFVFAFYSPFEKYSTQFCKRSSIVFCLLDFVAVPKSPLAVQSVETY